MFKNRANNWIFLLCLSAASQFAFAQGLDRELVMSEGLVISANTAEGDIQIAAGTNLLRHYTWEGSTRSAELWPRKERWYGNYGAYYPGPSLHWSDHNGIRRGVLEEGQQHFNTLEEAHAWLNLPYNAHCRYRDDGLVVCFSKSLNRHQINVAVWQILVGGKEPYLPIEATGERVWFYDPAQMPKAFASGKGKQFFKGGHKPTKLTGSCNECITVRTDS